MIVRVDNKLNTGLGHLNILKRKPTSLEFLFVNDPEINLNNSSIPLLFKQVKMVRLLNPKACTLKVRNLQYLIEQFYPEGLFKLALLRGWTLARLEDECSKQ